MKKKNNIIKIKYHYGLSLNVTMDQKVVLVLDTYTL